MTAYYTDDQTPHCVHGSPWRGPGKAGFTLVDHRMRRQDDHHAGHLVFRTIDLGDGSKVEHRTPHPVRDLSKSLGRQGSPKPTTDRGPDKHGPGSLSVDTGLLRARLAAIIARADGGLRLDTCSFQVEPDGSIRWFELAVDVGRPHPMVLAGGPIRRIEDAEDMVRAAVVDRRGGPHA